MEKSVYKLKNLKLEKCFSPDVKLLKLSKKAYNSVQNSPFLSDDAKIKNYQEIQKIIHEQAARLPMTNERYELGDVMSDCIDQINLLNKPLPNGDLPETTSDILAEKIAYAPESAYKTIFGKEIYNRLHSSLYDNHSKGLYKAYKKGLAKWIPPTLNIAPGDRDDIKDRRILTVLSKLTEDNLLSESEGIHMYEVLKKRNIKRMNNSGLPRGDRQSAQDIVNICDSKIKFICDKKAKGLEAKVAQV